MSNSLRDQLVKAGLATSGQARKAEKQQRAQDLAQRRSKAKPDGAAAPPPSAQDKARKLQSEKAARDRAAAQQRNDKYAQRALRAEIKQIIIQNDKRTKVADNDAVAYNFVHGKRVKRIYVSRDEREQLSSGRLIVINNDGNYHFVLPDVAKKIAQRDPRRIIVAHQEKSKEDAPSPDDEFYAKFEVPDDLDW